MASLSLTDRNLTSLAVDALVIGVGKGEDGPVLAPGAEAVDEALGGTLLDVLVSLGASGKEDEAVRFATLGQLGVPIIAAIGLGKATDGAYAEESVRRAAGTASRVLTGRETVASTLALVNGEPTPELVRAVGEGALLGAYTFTEYRSEKPKPASAPPAKIQLVVPSARAAGPRNAVKTATAVAEAVTLTRDLINTPPNDLYPASFADRARKAGEALGLSVEVLDEKKLARGGYGGIVGVGSGSSRPPRLVRLDYTPVKKKVPTVALIGKGITFDSGGISIKPAASMDAMKSDMSGAAAVIATALLAAKLKLPVRVIATVPLAENLPSGTAYRPADVLTFRNGKTAEILNTDAEGRVVLADAIARACEDGPDYLVETSTLTGAQIVALGNRVAGVMGSDDLRDRVVAASERSGEQMWPMPLPADVRKGMDSAVADIANIGDRSGGMLAGGHFLKEFVADGVPWAHIDIAGPSFNTGAPWGYTVKGGTGVPVRTLLALLEDIADQG